MSSMLPLLHAARASHAKGDLGAAIRGYDGILKREPKNYEAAYFRAVALYQAGKLDQALSAFGTAAKNDPRRFEPHKDRGLILVKLGRHAEAVDAFEAALKRSPQAPELLLNRGLALRNSGRTEEAVASYQAALARRPDFAEAHNNLANALGLLGRKEEALAAYRKAIALKPGYAEAHVNAADLLLTLDQPAEAASLLRQVLAHHPRHAAAYRSLARCHELAGEEEEALAAASRAIEIDGGADSYLARAHLHEEANREAEAAADYDKVLAREPGNVTALLGRARLLSRAKSYDEAIALCDRAIAAEPESPQAYYRIGRIFEAKGEFPAALMSYDKVILLDPALSVAKIRRAGALGELGRHEQALAAYDEVIAAEPDSAEAHSGRGHTLHTLRRLEDAVLAFDTAVALEPDRSSHYRIRGQIKTELGRAAEALEDYGRHLTLLARGDAQGEALVDDCIALLSVDKIPAIYASEAELAATRDRIEDVLDRLVAKYGSAPPFTPRQMGVAEQAIGNLTGFYLAYHQRNDRETMRKLSQVATHFIEPNRHEPAPRADGPIRVGIASQRLRNHNGANWAYNWFAQLPASDYAFFTYNFESTRDWLTDKFAALGSHRQISWSRGEARDVVQMMREDRLDYLMLTDVGMTPTSRFLSVTRIAPRQFTAWGHPVTTGSPEMDFYLSSDLMEPADGQEHYTEKLVRLPNLALFLEEREVEEREASGGAASTFGLPEGRVLYGCLQSLFKYLPRYDAILPRIAREVPEALFVFLEGMPAYTTTVMRVRLEAAFAAEGLDASRHVLFVPRQNPRGFDKLMQAMDVCIDSVGWSGGNTSLKSIALGVPLATLDGAFMRGRHTSAMFRMMGTEEFIAGSEEAYVDLLVRLGREQAYRAHCAGLFRAQRPRLYRDHSFIAGLDSFLKGNVPA